MVQTFTVQAADQKPNTSIMWPRRSTATSPAAAAKSEPRAAQRWLPLATEQLKLGDAFCEIWSRALRCVCPCKTREEALYFSFTHHGGSTEKCRELHEGGGQHDGGM